MSIGYVQPLKICKKKTHLSLFESYLILIRKSPYDDSYMCSYSYLNKYYFLNNGEKLVVEVYINSYNRTRKLRSKFQDITFCCPFAYAMIFKYSQILYEEYIENGNKRFEDAFESVNSALLFWEDWHN